MKILKYALLGQIMLGPKSGYDLMQEFGEKYSHTWYASHSQIYPELKKLTSEGLVEFDTEIQGKVLEKKIYRITEKGITEFRKWLMQDTDIHSAPKDEFRLKLLYISCVDPAEYLEKIEHYREKRLERTKKVADYLAECDENSTDLTEIGNYLVLMGAIMREQSYQEWLDLCYERLSNLKSTKE